MRTSRVVVLALVVGAIFVTQEVLTDLANGRPPQAANEVLAVMLYWVVWALLAPVVLLAVRRWPLDARPVYRAPLVHAGVALLMSASQFAVVICLQWLAMYLAGGAGALDALKRNFGPTPFLWGVFTGVFFYAIVAAVYTALRFRSLYVAEQVSAAALEAELTRSKLDTLRSQLRPHFLFNTLNAISVFVTEDAAAARQMILRLATLLRRSLDEEAHEVPLREELAFVNDYLDIQRGRFGDRLVVRIAVDPATLGASVPVFLLQPLLENAIEHGREDGASMTIVLRAGRDGDTLHIELADDGSGLSSVMTVREGIGLGNTRARLLQLYGPGASVTLGTAGAGAASAGARVDIRIPFRDAPALAPTAGVA